jgi:hypothetical protein
MCERLYGNTHRNSFDVFQQQGFLRRTAWPLFYFSQIAIYFIIYLFLFKLYLFHKLCTKIKIPTQSFKG